MYPTIWLVRHSIREDRKTTQAISETDCNISEDGIKLAENTAHILSKQVKEFTKIYSSPFRRTLETSYIISTKFKNVPIEISKNISEVIIDYFMEHMDIKLPIVLKKYLDSNNITVPESKENIFNRCKNFIDSINKSDDYNKDLLVVTHGGVINVIIKQLFPEYNFNIENRIPPDKYVPKYCDYIAIKFDNSKWKIISSNWFNV